MFHHLITKISNFNKFQCLKIKTTTLLLHGDIMDKNRRGTTNTKCTKMSTHPTPQIMVLYLQ